MGDDFKMTKIGLVVPVLKNFQGAIECLSTVRSYFPIITFVIPNHWLGLSVAESWNEGFKRAVKAKCTHVLIINDDILFSKDTVDNLVFSMFSPSDEKEVVMVTGRNVRGHMSPEELMEYSAPGGAREGASESPDFSCFMVKKDFQDKIGTFDENFRPAYFEDNDTHRRINLLGYMALNVNAPFYHFGSVTQNWNNTPSCVPEQFELNRQYYSVKWGGVPGAEQFDTPYGRKDLTPRDWYPVKIS